MSYNPKLHHRRSIRLKGYDYGQAGLYFITICCQGRACWFGTIENGEMQLNDFGVIAQNEWMNTANIRKNVELGAFVVMPNHIHGIIRLLGRGELQSPEKTTNGKVELPSPEITTNGMVELYSSEMEMGEFDSSELEKGECNSPEINNIVKGECNSPLRETVEFNAPQSSEIKTGEFDSPLRGPSNNIGAIVRGYKSAVTKQIRGLGNNGGNELNDSFFIVWQRNYYEHIIRTEESYNSISEYIINNPAKWQDDKFYTA